MNSRIKFTEHDYRDLYESWMSKALKTENEVMEEFSNRERELLYKYIDFTYQILSTLGIFAGFGFTAINNVQTLPLFIFGEGILITTILYGFIWLRKFYTSNLTPLQNSSREIFKLYKQRDEIFLKIANDFLMKSILEKNNLVNAQNKDQEVLNWIRNHTGENAPKGDLPPHGSMIFIALIGLICIFVSFLVNICT